MARRAVMKESAKWRSGRDAERTVGCYRAARLMDRWLISRGLLDGDGPARRRGSIEDGDWAVSAVAA